MGTPCGSAPTVATPSAGEVRARPRRAVAPTTATSTAGTRFVSAGQDQQHGEDAEPDEQGRRVGLVEALDELP